MTTQTKQRPRHTEKPAKPRKGLAGPKVAPRPLRRLAAAPLPRLTAGMLARGRLHIGQTAVPCAIGAASISYRKREGDHTSPAGHFRLIEGFFKPVIGQRPLARLPLRPINPVLGWCDDPDAPDYNRLIRLPARPRHETLWRDDGLYDFVIVLDYNIRPRRRGAGSAIFLHCARPDFKPTEGCIALRREDLRKLLPRLSRAAFLLVRR